MAERIQEIRTRIAAAARRAGRDGREVTLVAVSKTFPSHLIAEALDAGVTDLGENRAQELKEKAAVLGPRPRWHYVGYLQTNKVRQVVGTAVLIHAVDRLGLAESIARRAEAMGIEQDVLIEVNVSGEASKQGVEPPRAVSLALQIGELRGVRVRGMMTMPPFPEKPEDSRPYYEQLSGLGATLKGELSDADQLSMGMTRDFEVAVEEGATLVRVGEAIFGPRSR